MGLIDRFLSHGDFVHAIEPFTEAAKIGAYSFDELDTPYPYILSIPEETTEAILTEELERLGGCVERGIEFVELEQEADTVRAVLRSETGGQRTLAASWVVGTDGIHSAVRQTIKDEYDGQDYAAVWGVVDGRIDNWNRPRERVAAQISPPVVIPFPLRKQYWRIYFRPAFEQDDAVALISQRLNVVSPGARFVDHDQPQFFHAQSRVARRYRVGRVFVAGDAAHASNPIEGRGMNVGIQDAYNLGWKLALVTAGDARESLLDSYAAQRHPGNA